MEQETKLYTLLVFSENIAGILNQITAVFTRRQVNIESLNVSASSIKDVHKYTITAWSNEDQIIKITKQIGRKIDVISAHYYTDDEIFIQEVGLYKLSTPEMLKNTVISKIVRQHDAKIVEVNPTYTIVIKTGLTDEITSLYYALTEFDCVLQYSRTGRIAITKSCVERVSEYLERREGEYQAE